MFTRPRGAVGRAGAAAFLVLFAVVSRLTALFHPRPIDDELVYAVVARVMLHGGKPYLDAIERKPPLLFWVYQGVFATAGDSNWLALHALMLVWTLATIAALYVCARTLWTPAAGWWAAALYALYAIWGDYRTLALNGELLMNLPLIVALGLLLAPAPAHWRTRVCLSGALTAVAFLLKQPAGVGIVPVVFLAIAHREPNRNVAARLFDASSALAGFCSVIAVAGLVLARQGVLREAVYWTFLDHELSPSDWLRLTLRNGPVRVALFTISTLPLLVGAGISLRAWFRRDELWRLKEIEFGALSAFLAMSIVGVVSNGQFLIHYFIQLVPPLAVLAAPVFASEFDARASSVPMPVGPRALAGWLLMTAVVFCGADAIQLSHHRQTSAAAGFVRARSLPADRLFVWGQSDDDTGMYLEADRDPATRYISIYPLTGLMFGSARDRTKELARTRLEAWLNFTNDLAAHAPRFVIDADSADGGTYPIGWYPTLARYLTGYRRVWEAQDGIVYERVTANSGRANGR